DMTPFLQPVIARGVARYFGEPVAVVVAESRAQAETAAEEIKVDWQPLPVVARAEEAEEGAAGRIHPAGNVASSWHFNLGDAETAFKDAAAYMHESFSVQRHTGMPLETRGLLAEFNHATGLLEVFGPTKVP